MTAVAVIPYPDQVVILSDGAHFSGGVVHAIGPKALALPHLPAAFVVRGPTELGPFIQWMMPHFGAFDDLIKGMPIMLPLIHDKFPTAVPQDIDFAAFEIIMAGWSEREQQVVAGVIPGHDGYAAQGVPRMTWGRFRDLVFVPTPTSDTGWETPSGVFDPRTDGIRLFEAMRRTKEQPHINRPNDPRVHYTGGLLQLTSVTRAGVWSEIIHRWPDEIGKELCPFN